MDRTDGVTCLRSEILYYFGPYRMEVPKFIFPTTRQIRDKSKENYWEVFEVVVTRGSPLWSGKYSILFDYQVHKAKASSIYD